MKSLSSVGIALSLVFGCLFLALVAEVYYLLWWKKRIITNTDELLEEDGYNSTFFCWKKAPSDLRLMSSRNLCSSSHEILVHEPQVHTAFGGEEESADSDILSLQNFSLEPPRFLFTIKEETKEDLESEDGKSKISKSRSRSLSDLFLHHAVETPYLTPMASPPYYTPPLTPARGKLHSQKGFEAEFNWFSSSPPPMFKFLRDADEKRSSNQNPEYCPSSSPSSSTSSARFLKDDFITLIVNNAVQEERNVQVQYLSNTSQVLPLASSPPLKVR